MLIRRIWCSAFKIPGKKVWETARMCSDPMLLIVSWNKREVSVGISVTKTLKISYLNFSFLDNGSFIYIEIGIEEEKRGGNIETRGLGTADRDTLDAVLFCIFISCFSSRLLFPTLVRIPQLKYHIWLIFIQPLVPNQFIIKKKTVILPSFSIYPWFVVPKTLVLE